MKRAPAVVQPLLSAILALLATAPALAAGAGVVLGDRAEIYRAVAGSYGDLFPEGGATAAETSVLALDVTEPGRARQRYLVPGTEGDEVDGTPSLVFESESDIAYLIWESRLGPATSRVLLAGFDGDGWTEPVELTGDVSPLKSAPEVLFTRDRYDRPTVTEGVISQARTVLHVVWWEQAADGAEAVQYTPVVLEGGTYIGWNPVHRLNDLDPAAAADGGTAPPRALYRSPTLSPGTDLHTVVIAFANRETRRLLTVEARVLPGELGLMAERLRSAVEAAGYDPGEDRIRSIRGILRSEIIEIGQRFNPGVVSHLAAAVVAAAETLHETAPDRPVRGLADDLRSEIIEIGVNVLGDVNRTPRAKASRVLEARRAEGSEGAAGAVPNLVRLRLVRDLPAPAEPDGPSRIYVAQDGTHLLVSWQSGDRLHYAESLPETVAGAGDGAEPVHWTAPRVLDLGDEIDPQAVEQILNTRVRQHP